MPSKLFLISTVCVVSSFRCLVSKLFDVCPRSTLEEMEQQDEVRVAWGSGIAGYVAESGEPVNIPDAYQVGTQLKHTQVVILLCYHSLPPPIACKTSPQIKTMTIKKIANKNIIYLRTHYIRASSSILDPPSIPEDGVGRTRVATYWDIVQRYPFGALFYFFLFSNWI